jgi:hypothetical protein
MKSHTDRRGWPFVKRVIFLFVIIGLGLLFASRLDQTEEIAAYPENRVLRSARLEGITYKLADDGNVFRVIDERGTYGIGWITFSIPNRFSVNL